MELTFILFILLFILVIYLIFKFIKKVIFAVIATFVLVILVIAGIAGLVYLDFKSLSSQEVFAVKLIYSQDETLLYGINIPFENGEPLMEEVSGISNIKTLSTQDLSDNEGEFVILVDEEIFGELIENETFSFEALGGEEFGDYNLTFTGSEISDILDSNSPEDTLIELVFEKANIPSFLIESAKPAAKEILISVLEERDLTLKEAIFSLTMLESLQDESNSLRIVEAFKNDEIQILSDRIVFDLVKLIPAQTIEENIPSSLLE